MEQQSPFNAELRTRLFRPLFGVGVAGALIYLLLGLIPGVGEWTRAAIYPWDGVCVVVVSLWSAWMLRRGNISQAGNWFVVGVLWAVGFNLPFYGVASPVTALFLPGIVISGLLIGRWSQGMMVALCGFFVAFFGFMEMQGWGEALTPTRIESWPDFVRTTLFWWSLIGLTGWLVYLFASNLEQAVQAAQGQTTALARSLHTLSTEPTADAFLPEVVTVIMEHLSATWATLWIYQPEAERLAPTLGFHRSGAEVLQAPKEALPPPVLTKDLPIWQEMRQHREPVVIQDMANDPRLRLRAQLLAEGVKTVLHLPLLLGEQMTGSLSLQSTEKRAYRPDELALAESLVQQVTLAMRLNQLSEQVQETAITSERNRMAREIHDTLAQGFTGIVVQLEAAEDALVHAPSDAAQHLDRARRLARSSLNEARRSVWALRPQILEETSLPAALDTISRELTQGTSIAVSVETEGVVAPLAPPVGEQLLRVGQEALTNALKHAQPSQVTIRLSYDPETVTLHVEDDGKGFEPKTQRGNGFGLVGMAERVNEIDGTLTITSQPGEGTVLSVRVKR